jgi:hypothetical protein
MTTSGIAMEVSSLDKDHLWVQKWYKPGGGDTVEDSHLRHEKRLSAKQARRQQRERNFLIRQIPSGQV